MNITKFNISFDISTTMDSKTLFDGERWIDILNGEIVFFTYIYIYCGLILLCVLYSLIVIKTKTDKTNKNNQNMNKPKTSIKQHFCSAWQLRGLYGSVIVQIFDQASDFGVLLLYLKYQYYENELNSDIIGVEMNSIVYSSILFIILPRVIWSLFVIADFNDYYNTKDNADKANVDYKYSKYFDAFLFN